MHVLRYISLLCIILSACAFSQSKDSVLIGGNYKVVIDSIRIKGNQKTKDFIILRELTFKEKDTLTTSIAEYNRDRVYSLSLFGTVEIIPYQFNDHITAYIIVEESWYIWPIPFAELKDKDWKKVSYGLDLSVKNIFGYNERFNARVTLGFDPSYYLFYSNPVIDRSNKYIFSSEFSYSTIENKSKLAEKLAGKNFEQKFINVQAGIGKRISLYEWASAYLGFSYVESPFYAKGISASNVKIDRIPFLSVGYVYDTRDLAQFAKKGLLLSGNGIFKGLSIDKVAYEVLNLDFRGYKELFTDIFGKARLATRNTFGNEVPYYDYSFLGYGERVRGYSNDIMEGENYYFFSLEAFTPIIREMRISFEWVPLLPKSLLIYKFALYAQAFADAGLAYNYGSKINANRTQKGYGAGLTFLILPYDMARIEFAVNEFRNSELRVELGISF